MQTNFLPPRRLGGLFQAGAAFLLLGAAALSFSVGWRQPAGGGFPAFLALAVILAAPAPLLFYRLFALLGGGYSLERDGIRLRWGLRQEDIPLLEVDWVRPPDQILDLLPGRPRRLPLPFLWWPGGLRGERTVAGLGPVEFMASDPRRILLVATPQRIFAISPADPQGFQQAFNRIAELGSLSPLAHQSVYPSSIFSRLWADRPARTLVLAGLGLGLALLAWVGLAIPGRAAVPLGFTPAGVPLAPSPAERLLLLPVVDGLIYLADLLAGLYCFRHARQRPVAYLLWAGGAITPALLLVAVGMILAS